MQIIETRRLELPEGLVCKAGKRPCPALSQAQGAQGQGRLCGYFNRFCFWSPQAGEFVRCPDCLDAAVNYLRGGH